MHIINMIHSVHKPPLRIDTARLMLKDQTLPSAHLVLSIVHTSVQVLPTGSEVKTCQAHRVCALMQPVP